MSIEDRNLFTRSFEQDSRNEWLETNGLGGFACGTVSGCPTRKYHGLLAAPVKGREGRFLFFHALETALLSNGGNEEIGLGVNKYPGVHHPWGYAYIESFTIFPFPRWIYSTGTARLSREIIMPREREEVIIRYSILENREKALLRLSPRFSFRDIHSLSFENRDISPKVVLEKNSVTLSPYAGLPKLKMECSNPVEFHEQFFWDKSIEYSVEEERGFDFKEDRFSPGWWPVEISEGDTVCIRVSLSTPHEGIEDSITREEKRRREGFRRYGRDEENLGWLKYKGEDFLIRNDRGEPSINAGYPWFGEWGRDTMTALPGLTFYSGREATGGEILKTYAGYIRDGLLPNTLGGLQGFYSYNSIDAGLLYFKAVQEMDRAGIDPKMVKTELLPVLASLIRPYLENRVPYTTLEEDGLLSAGTEETQLTWMDATAWGKPQTPRHGKTVEINALWYNALCFFRELSLRYGRAGNDDIDTLIGKIPASFRSVFWLPENNYCADCVQPNSRDTSIRPNMLFAAALPYSPLTKKEAADVVAVVEQYLLTPCGLRTLSPDNPSFRKVYEGNGNQRDSAYHQGTVWSWLFGLYVEAALRSAENPKKKAKQLREHLNSFLTNHLFVDGIGMLSEIFDGLNPGRGKGAFGMAWSSGEMIRSFALLDKA